MDSTHIKLFLTNSLRNKIYLLIYEKDECFANKSEQTVLSFAFEA